MLKQCLVKLACGLSATQLDVLCDIAPLDHDGEVPAVVPFLQLFFVLKRFFSRS